MKQEKKEDAHKIVFEDNGKDVCVSGEIQRVDDDVIFIMKDNYIHRIRKDRIFQVSGPFTDIEEMFY